MMKILLVITYVARVVVKLCSIVHSKLTIREDFGLDNLESVCEVRQPLIWRLVVELLESAAWTVQQHGSCHVIANPLQALHTCRPCQHPRMALCKRTKVCPMDIRIHRL